MSLNIPEKIQLENNKIIADGYVDLFQFTFNEKLKLPNGEIVNSPVYLFLKENNSVTWGTHEVYHRDTESWTDEPTVWQGIPLLFEGWENSSLTSPKRPTFTCGNPNGVYSGWIKQEALVGAMMTRYRVLYDDIVNNRPIYIKQKWRCWSVKSFTNQTIVLEMRSPMDGFNVKLPPRTYRPPEFPVVRMR